jgi:hypothetical protein
MVSIYFYFLEIKSGIFEGLECLLECDNFGPL